MPKTEFQIAIVEDDPFARNWMALLAARDWRTRLAGEFDEPLKTHPPAAQKSLVCGPDPAGHRHPRR